MCDCQLSQSLAQQSSWQHGAPNGKRAARSAERSAERSLQAWLRACCLRHCAVSCTAALQTWQIPQIDAGQRGAGDLAESACKLLSCMSDCQLSHPPAPAQQSSWQHGATDSERTAGFAERSLQARLAACCLLYRAVSCTAARETMTAHMMLHDRGELHRMALAMSAVHGRAYGATVLQVAGVEHGFRGASAGYAPRKRLGAPWCQLVCCTKRQ